MQNITLASDESSNTDEWRSRAVDVKDLIENIAKSIVDKPELVSVTGVEGENSVVIELKVDRDDVGRVIGKNGRTINAMRTILSATRAQKEKRQVLEVLD